MSKLDLAARKHARVNRELRLLSKDMQRLARRARRLERLLARLPEGGQLDPWERTALQEALPAWAWQAVGNYRLVWPLVLAARA